MLNIIKKSQNELEGEQGLYNFAAVIAKGHPRRVCPTYVMVNGDKKNTWDLTEEEVLSLIVYDVADYSRNMDSYTKRRGKEGIASFDLIGNLSSNFRMSPKGVVFILNAYKRYGHIMMDILGSLSRYGEYYDQASIIARYQKETAGDYSLVTVDDIIAVLEQMEKNKENKKNQVRTK